VTININRSNTNQTFGYINEVLFAEIVCISLFNSQNQPHFTKQFK